jgi:hypothetical protein
MKTAAQKIMNAVLGTEEWFAKSKERFINYQANYQKTK